MVIEHFFSKPSQMWIFSLFQRSFKKCSRTNANRQAFFISQDPAFPAVSGPSIIYRDPRKGIVKIDFFAEKQYHFCTYLH